MDSDNKKITQLTVSVPVATDVMPYVSSPGTSPVTKKATISNLLNGWVEVSDTWAYASASTITIPTDGTTVYQKGMKIRFKQGGSYKYYNVAAVTATLLPVVVNTDYTVANSAITDIAYSCSENPYGFPHHFTWVASSITGFSSNPTITTTYSITGNKLFFEIGTSDGTGNSNAFTFSMPVAARKLCTGSSSLIRDNSTNLGSGYWQIAAGTATMDIYKAALAAWTNAAGKGVYLSGFYEI